MRIGALITGILGGLLSAMLGMKWQADANEHAELLEAAKSLGADTAQLDAILTASWFMVGGLVVGIVGGVLALKGRGKIGGALMLATALIPGLFTGKALVGTFVLAIGGVLALLSKPKKALA